jgi:hypothetical protein
VRFALPLVPSANRASSEQLKSILPIQAPKEGNNLTIGPHRTDDSVRQRLRHSPDEAFNNRRRVSASLEEFATSAEFAEQSEGAINEPLAHCRGLDGCSSHRNEKPPELAEG